MLSAAPLAGMKGSAREVVSCLMSIDVHARRPVEGDERFSLLGHVLGVQVQIVGTEGAAMSDEVAVHPGASRVAGDELDDGHGRAIAIAPR